MSYGKGTSGNNEADRGSHFEQDWWPVFLSPFEQPHGQDSTQRIALSWPESQRECPSKQHKAERKRWVITKSLLNI
ncbi:hypothetical protein LB507_005970 [Fusarium sp. FIESC RH6]|nr:hypothetical protein LB507_005970 [Fusarium sp. FIESC RH6]